MRRGASVALFVGMLAIAGGMAAFAGADGTHETTIEVTASGDCTAPDVFCWEVEGGEVHAGGTVTFMVTNGDGNDHNFYVDVTGDHAGPDGGGTERSSPSSAEGHVGSNEEALAEDGSGEVTVDVPADAEEIYFWCDISGHEMLGMWAEIAVTADGGGTTNGEDDDETGSPAIGLFAALVGISLAAFALSRRR